MIYANFLNKLNGINEKNINMNLPIYLKNKKAKITVFAFLFSALIINVHKTSILFQLLFKQYIRIKFEPCKRK